jgi:8-oxo-dGTP diphosphatase
MYNCFDRANSVDLLAFGSILGLPNGNGKETIMTLHQCVGALIIQQHTLLLGQRSPTRTFYPSRWDIFGGHIEPGEQPEQTLIRELQEELGITPTQWTYVDTFVESVPERDEEIYCHVYLVLAWRGMPVNQQLDEHTTIAWFSLDQALQLELAHPAYPQLFSRVLASAAPA